MTHGARPSVAIADGRERIPREIVSAIITIGELLLSSAAKLSQKLEGGVGRKLPLMKLGRNKKRYCCHFRIRSGRKLMIVEASRKVL